MEAVSPSSTCGSRAEDQTLLQLAIPDALRGRLTSPATLNLALNPIGAPRKHPWRALGGVEYAATVALISSGS